MDDLGDIKLYRKNLIIVSIINILIIIFIKDIIEINFLGLIKINPIESNKLLLILAVANLYTFLRYIISFSKEKPSINYTLQFKVLCKNIFMNSLADKNNLPHYMVNKINGKITKGSIQTKDSIEYEVIIGPYNNLLYRKKGAKKFINDPLYKNIFSNNIVTEKFKDGSLWLYCLDELPSPIGYNIFIYNDFKSRINLLGMRFRLGLLNSYYIDYLLPLILGFFSILIIYYKIIFN